MRRVAQCLSLAVIAAAFAVTPLDAGIIFDNGLPIQTGGNEMTHWIQAEEFLVAPDFTLTGIHFWSAELDGAYLGSITYTIYDNAGSQPGNILQRDTIAPTTRTATGNTLIGLPDYLEYEYHLDIAPLSLAGGVGHWVGLHNGPLTEDLAAGFYWQHTTNNSLFNGREDNSPFDDNSWSNTSEEHAFYVTGDPVPETVPEPGTLLLIGSGLVGLAARRRRS